MRLEPDAHRRAQRLEQCELGIGGDSAADAAHIGIVPQRDADLGVETEHQAVPSQEAARVSGVRPVRMRRAGHAEKKERNLSDRFLHGFSSERTCAHPIARTPRAYGARQNRDKWTKLRWARERGAPMVRVITVELKAPDGYGASLAPSRRIRSVRPPAGNEGRRALRLSSRTSAMPRARSRA